MGDKAFRVLVILALLFICISQAVQGFEAADRLIRREQIRVRIPDMETNTRTAMLGPDVKSVWHQVFVQLQAATEYLKIIAAK
jgi:membrane glycosyltransferase